MSTVFPFQMPLCCLFRSAAEVKFNFIFVILTFSFAKPYTYPLCIHYLFCFSSILCQIGTNKKHTVNKMRSNCVLCKERIYIHYIVYWIQLLQSFNNDVDGKRAERLWCLSLTSSLPVMSFFYSFTSPLLCWNCVYVHMCAVFFPAKWEKEEIQQKRKAYKL